MGTEKKVYRYWPIGVIAIALSILIAVQMCLAFLKFGADTNPNLLVAIFPVVTLLALLISSVHFFFTTVVVDGKRICVINSLTKNEKILEFSEIENIEVFCFRLGFRVFFPGDYSISIFSWGTGYQDLKNLVNNAKKLEAQDSMGNKFSWTGYFLKLMVWMMIAGVALFILNY